MWTTPSHPHGITSGSTTRVEAPWDSSNEATRGAMPRPSSTTVIESPASPGTSLGSRSAGVAGTTLKTALTAASGTPASDAGGSARKTDAAASATTDGESGTSAGSSESLLGLSGTLLRSAPPPAVLGVGPDDVLPPRCPSIQFTMALSDFWATSSSTIDSSSESPGPVAPASPARSVSSPRISSRLIESMLRSASRSRSAPSMSSG